MDSQENSLSIEDRFKATLTTDSLEQPAAEVAEPTEELDQLDNSVETEISNELEELPELEEVDNDQADDDGEEFEEDENELTSAEIDLEATYLIDGQEMTGQEIKDGYLRQSDYTRKTQELAQEREAVTLAETQAKQNLELGVTALGMLTSEIDQKLMQYQQVDWSEIAASDDPKRYNQMQADMQALATRKQQLQQQVQQLFETHNQQAEQAKAEQAQQAITVLKEQIPNWNGQVYTDLQRAGVEAGYTEQEMLEMTDPRLFILLHKAKQADSAKKVATKKRVKASPKRALQTGSPREINHREREKAALGQLKQSGSVDDAALAFKARLNTKR